MKKCFINLNCQLFIILFICIHSNMLYAEEYVGPANVIDGDTLYISGVKIRLYGIDSPEIKQLCIDPHNKKWECGISAKKSLKKYIANNVIKCEGKNKDRYNRVVASCYMHGQDIQEWIVKNGWAIAYRRYSKKYIEDEIQAKSNNLGIWNGSFLEPYKWRKKNR